MFSNASASTLNFPRTTSSTRNFDSGLDHPLALTLLLPPTLGLCLTFGPPPPPVPFTSPPPSSPSTLTVLRRRLLLTFGDVFALAPAELLGPCWLCCAIRPCVGAGEGVCVFCIKWGEPLIALGRPRLAIAGDINGWFGGTPGWPKPEGVRAPGGRFCCCCCCCFWCCCRA